MEQLSFAGSRIEYPSVIRVYVCELVYIYKKPSDIILSTYIRSDFGWKEQKEKNKYQRVAPDNSRSERVCVRVYTQSSLWKESSRNKQSRTNQKFIDIIGTNQGK